MADNSGMKLSQPWEITQSSGQAGAVDWNVRGKLNLKGGLYLYDSESNTYKEVQLYDDGTRLLLYVEP